MKTPCYLKRHPGFITWIDLDAVRGEESINSRHKITSEWAGGVWSNQQCSNPSPKRTESRLRKASEIDLFKQATATSRQDQRAIHSPNCPNMRSWNKTYLLFSSRLTTPLRRAFYCWYFPSASFKTFSIARTEYMVILTKTAQFEKLFHVESYYCQPFVASGGFKVLLVIVRSKLADMSKF